MVAGALEEGGDAIDDAAWGVGSRYPDVPGEEFIEEVATGLGYDDLF